MIVADVDRDAATRVAEGLPGDARSVALDVSDAQQWADVVSAVEADFGEPIEVLVNSAGILRAGPLESADIDLWRRVIEVNLVGTMLGMQTVIPGQRKRGGGVIVNTGSTAGTTGVAGLSAYSSSKWALRGLTRTAAIELGPHNVRVNLVVPGVIDTPRRAPLGTPARCPIKPSPPSPPRKRSRA